MTVEYRHLESAIEEWIRLWREGDGIFQFRESIAYLRRCQGGKGSRDSIDSLHAKEYSRRVAPLIWELIQEAQKKEMAEGAGFEPADHQGPTP